MNENIEHHINEDKTHKLELEDFRLKCSVKFTYVIIHDSLVSFSLVFTPFAY